MRDECSCASGGVGLDPCGRRLKQPGLDADTPVRWTPHVSQHIQTIDGELFVPGQAPWPPDIARLWDARGHSPRYSSRPLGNEQLGAYGVLADHEGLPVGILRTVTPRDTKARFEAMARYLLSISLLLAVLLTLAAIWVLE